MVAKSTVKAQSPATGMIGWVSGTVSRWLGNNGGSPAALENETQRGHFSFGEYVTPQALYGGTNSVARPKQTIYAAWTDMLQDPIVASALRIHVTAALGGHETTGSLIFIEPKASHAKDEDAMKIADMLRADLVGHFNSIAMPLCYNAIAYGDGYARMFGREKDGILGLSVDETMLPPLVSAYEQAGQTRACVVAVGQKLRETLTMDQIARMRMQRMQYVPQPMAVEKAWHGYVKENDPNKQILMPALAGGSFLIDAEKQYGNFTAALNGLVGQRILDSIDESMFAVQVAGMTKEQRQEFLTSMGRVLQSSRDVATNALKSGKVFLGRIRHLLPVFGEKQILQVQSVNSAGGSGAGRAGNVSIDDVLLHAKLLSGALGVDLAMLGFSEMLSGGLGDGGFFRVSIQAAERSRAIRVALSDCLNHIMQVHLLLKLGREYKVEDLPVEVQFYSSISALETERQRTAADAANTAAVFVQTMTQLRDLGMQDDAALKHFFSKILKLDDEAVPLYVKAIKAAKPPAPDGGGFGDDGGGGFGGDEGGEPLKAPGGADAENDDAA
jgi:hypothetical protein